MQNLFESSALQYEKLGQIPASPECTFVREETTAAQRSQESLLTPSLLQQLMLNSEQLFNQKLGSKHKHFATIDFNQHALESQGRVDHLFSAQFDEPALEDDREPLPVLGLNLKEYFQKRHLVDQVPVEPLPPIENPLEMTQNHDDWVRSQEDFRINLERLQKLPKPGDKHIFASELVSDVFSPHEPQKEIAKLHENLKSLSSSFEVKSWETLTQKHRGEGRTRAANPQIERLGFSQAHDAMNDSLQRSGALTAGKTLTSESQSLLLPANSIALIEEKVSDAPSLGASQSSSSLTTRTLVGEFKTKPFEADARFLNGSKQPQSDL